MTLFLDGQCVDHLGVVWNSVAVRMCNNVTMWQYSPQETWRPGSQTWTRSRGHWPHWHHDILTWSEMETGFFGIEQLKWNQTMTIDMQIWLECHLMIILAWILEQKTWKRVNLQKYCKHTKLLNSFIDQTLALNKKWREH